MRSRGEWGKLKGMKISHCEKRKILMMLLNSLWSIKVKYMKNISPCTTITGLTPSKVGLRLDFGDFSNIESCSKDLRFF